MGVVGASGQAAPVRYFKVFLGGLPFCRLALKTQIIINPTKNIQHYKCTRRENV